MSRRVAPYLVTMAGVALLTSAKVSYPPIGADLPFLLYFVVVLSAAWYGDRWSGAFATVLCAGVANYFFLGGGRGLALGVVPLVQTGVFVLEGTGMIVLVDLIRAARASSERAAARVEALQRLTAELAAARTARDVAKVVVTGGVEALGAAAGAMVRVSDDDELELLAASSKDSALEEASERAHRSGRTEESKTSVAMPLVLDGAKLGTVAFRFAPGRRFDEARRSLLATVVEQAAQSLARAVGFEREVWLRTKLGVLSDVAAALSRAGTRAEVAEVVVERGVPAMNADTCMLYVLDESGQRLELVGAHGVAEAIVDPIRVIDASSRSNPSWTAFQAGAAVWVETREAYRERFPDVATIAVEGPRAQAFWSLPLVVEGRPVGLLAMGYYRERRFTKQTRSFIETFTQQCAQAVVRALRLDRETAARVAAEAANAELERAHGRQALVTEASAAMAASLDYETTLTRLAAVLVPTLADWCAIEMIDEASGESAQITVAHSDPAKVEHAWALRRRYPPRTDTRHGMQHVLRTGKPELYVTVTDEMLTAAAVDDEHLRLARELGLRSAILVPLVARGQILGGITLVHAESGRQYDDDDLALVEEIARRAATSVDNARLYGREQRARAAADDANRLKDEFLATVSHELRTPLNAILGWSRMITTGSLDDARRSRAHQTIERNATAMAQLIDDLLDVSRIISGKMRLEVEPVDLAPVVEAALDSIRPAAAAKEIALRAVIEPAPGPLLGDPNRLQQVVWNLLSNAVKFTPNGGKVEVHVRRHESSIELRVSDSGAGIDPAFVPFVFDRFRQADGRITRSHGGLGLGLAITRQLVELHGGSVRADSDGPGRGATFTVRLPISAMRPLESARPAIAASEQTMSRELAGLTVLAVDDDDDARRLVQLVLESAGARVMLAASVDEAMAAFDSHVPDVVVSDIGMPGADGVELIRRIRARTPEQGGRVPAAALTAYSRAGDRTRVLTAGYLMHVPKPVEPDELLAVVVNLARFAERAPSRTA